MIMLNTQSSGFALSTELVYEPPMWVHLVLSLLLTLIACVGLWLKGIPVVQQYRTRAEQGRFEI
jgi:uncharacterized protein (DUF983 family)